MASGGSTFGKPTAEGVRDELQSMTPQQRNDPEHLLHEKRAAGIGVEDSVFFGRQGASDTPATPQTQLGQSNQSSGGSAPIKREGGQEKAALRDGQPDRLTPSLLDDRQKKANGSLLR